MAPELIISHISKDTSRIQTNQEHSYGVASLAESFASDFGMGEWGRIIGLLHDKGKERFSFQNYIRKVSGLSPETKWNGEEKNHAFIGALIANKIFKGASSLISYPIMGHHAGLYDYTDYREMLKKPIPEEISQSDIQAELQLPYHISSLDRDTLIRSFHHLIRVLFSCLVDADYLDTEAFMNPENSKRRRRSINIELLKEKLDQYLSNLFQNSKTTDLNLIREQIQKKCIEASNLQPGFFSLAVPTGGGKTLSSLAWAINHAIKNGLKHIIIAIPYTSIVTQTASILTSIFGEEYVLEHHSDFNPEKVTDPDLRHSIKLSTENWDYPIVVTTNVQLFDSIFSNKPSKCRKLHNITKSVIILDEVQSLPLGHFQPIIDSLISYHKLFGCSILFSSASLPALSGEIIWGHNSINTLRGINKIHEIIPVNWKLHDLLRRTQIHIREENDSINEIVHEILKHKQLLCIVNTRKIAKEIYENLPQSLPKYHLSRMMCSAHIREVLIKVKECLKYGKPIVVIATQLIEAGVDIDFPIVFRQEAGLDSILQAAGRCNREGLNEKGDVIVFKLDNPPFGEIGKAANARESLPKDSDWFDPQIMKEYFIQLYSRNPSFDKINIANLLYVLNNWNFKTASNEFSLIDDENSKNVIVNYENSSELINNLKTVGVSYSLLKELSQYSVTLRLRDFEKMFKNGIVEEIIPGIYYIPDKGQYSYEVGLISESHWQEEILII